LGFGPRLRLGQPPPRGREGYRVHGGDRAAAGLGPLGHVEYASSLEGAAFRGRRGDGPARQLLHRTDPAERHPAPPLRRGDGGVPTAVRRARRGATADADVAPADPHRGRARRRDCDRGRLRELAGDEPCTQAVREGRARSARRRRRESRLRPRLAGADRGEGRGAPLRPGRFAGRDRAGHRRLDGHVALTEAMQGHDGVASEQMTQIAYRRIAVDSIEIFYREAGSSNAPALLLLHGFPTASHMFRDLIPQLADQLHVIAPDLPGFGQSDMPERTKFSYSFDTIAGTIDRFTEVIGLGRFAIYVFDYGATTGFRLAMRHHERITANISTDGNESVEGIVVA